MPIMLLLVFNIWNELAENALYIFEKKKEYNLDTLSAV